MSKPIAVFYGGSQGGWQVVEELHDKLNTVSVSEACFNNQLTSECNYRCDQCWSDKRVCKKCLEAGFEEWHPAARPCLMCH